MRAPGLAVLSRPPVTAPFAGRDRSLHGTKASDSGSFLLPPHQSTVLSFLAPHGFSPEKKLFSDENFPLTKHGKKWYNKE